MHFLFDQTGDGSRYIDWLLSGLLWTVALWICAGIAAFIIGVFVGSFRTAPSTALRIIGRIYVQIFRNIPLIVQAFLWYFVLPEVVPSALGTAIKAVPPPWASFIPAVVALSLYTGSRVAEQIRAGINALPDGQVKAAHALGMSTFQAYRLILLPQALRITVPTLTSEALGLFKNTSVALTIGLLEVMAQAQQINEYTFNTFGAFGSATVIYLLTALVIYQSASMIERWVDIPGSHTAASRN
ncbi:amino acid ABC transporter permease [Paraburkholderia phenoliruptrix]|uniref:amino acid ABC transporter permease n=1 Tax=Paraburkholderia phenoliruptrix TaxID=252970 RepID=UPI0028699DFB|nr:amino acid ABC transporter permease [Paraburkholderia phenoliruptrix]WMY10979.1 amino acid ABC transporter permease [Paraburkholderia phenoliruptrix]